MSYTHSRAEETSVPLLRFRSVGAVAGAVVLAVHVACCRAQTENPLGDALPYLRSLQQFSADDVETQLLAFDIHMVRATAAAVVAVGASPSYTKLVFPFPWNAGHGAGSRAIIRSCVPSVPCRSARVTIFNARTRPPCASCVPRVCLVCACCVRAACVRAWRARRGCDVQRRKKHLLALQAIKRAVALAADDARVHRIVNAFFVAVDGAEGLNLSPVAKQVRCRGVSGRLRWCCM